MSATTYSFSGPIDPSVGDTVQSAFINDAGEVVGTYTDANFVTHGFTDISGTITTVNDGTAATTDVTAVNDGGAFVGYGVGAGGIATDWFVATSAGVLTDFADPMGVQVEPVAVNAGGTVVGSYNAEGFIGTAAGGLTALVSAPGAQTTTISAINAGGTIVGDYNDASGVQHGFIDAAGVITTVDPAGSIQTTLNAINASGEAAGTFEDSSGNTSGFTDSAGVISTFAVPSNFGLVVTGINDAGAVAGYYVDSNDLAEESFVLSGGVLATVSVPNSPDTEILGINDGGTIVGVSDDTNGFEHGFTASPAAPAVVTLGAGPSTLALFVSERAEPAGAQFTISVDGVQVGGVQTTAADSTIGAVQQFDVLGSFPVGSNTVSIDYLNADDSLLNVESASVDGVAVANSAITLSNDGSLGFSFASTGMLTPVMVGSGPDTLALSVSERAEPGAQFTISVDGSQVGGVQTTSANVLAGQNQVFDVAGNFGSGIGTVTIDYLNASNSLLFANDLTLNGSPITPGEVVLSNTGSATVGFTGPGVGAPVAIGSGADTLALSVSERGQPAGAQFTVDVDGQQVGGVQTTTADSTQGQSGTIDVLGNFATGSNTVTINDLNASNSLLNVTGASINGAAVPGGALTLSNIGSAGFSFALPSQPAGPAVVGSGADTLALTLSQFTESLGTAFTVSVDGAKIGTAQAVTANGFDGQTQVLDVLGNFAPGQHTATIAYSAPADSSLYLNNASIDGLVVAGSNLAISSTSPASFGFTAVAHG